MGQLTDYEKADLIIAEGSFQSRVKGAMIKAALDVKGEDYTPVTTTHPVSGQEITGPSTEAIKRGALATQVLQSPLAMLERFNNVIGVAPGIITKFASTINAERDDEDFEERVKKQVIEAVTQITDNDIQFTVNTVWNDIAGVDAWDTPDAGK